MSCLFENLITSDDIANISVTEQLIFDDDRISVLKAMNSIDVQACPGSGKTTLIATKLILLSKKWTYSDKGICVLSHTNVAKEEIISRLEKSDTIEARRLLSYPHFIGTIQEFVNRFLAVPSLRSEGVCEVTVDNDRYLEAASKLLTLQQFSWLRRSLNGLGGGDNLDGFLKQTYRYVSDPSESINISMRPKAWADTNAYMKAERDLLKLKSYLDGRGIFLFRDMYTHAQIAISKNPELSDFLSERYPIVFIDEMQDTQKFQDVLLNQIFSRDNQALAIQRFGDPDQAIFHGFKKDEANESYNNKSLAEMDYVIYKSHRFDNSVADKAKLFSLNEIPLESELSDETLAKSREAHVTSDDFEHTIIIFNDESCCRVAELFAQVVSNQFSDRYKRSSKFTAKILGAVGNEINTGKDQLKIGHYWSGYDKAKSKANYKESTLIEAVWHCRHSSSLDWADNYKLLIKCVLKFLRLSNKSDENNRYYTSSTMREMLKNGENWKKFRKVTHLMLDSYHQLSQESWASICFQMRCIFGLEEDDGNAQVSEYLAFAEYIDLRSFSDSITEREATKEKLSDNASQESSDEGCLLTELSENRLEHSDGFKVEFSTIHGAKGETHDATLILETKNHIFDLETMLPYLLGSLPSSDNPNCSLPDKPHSKRKFSPNKVFMRQLFVAMSRPRYLLCLALHSDRISEESRNLLAEKGWKVEVI